uniref:Bile acid:sodium symporter family protein n=1 Tax=Roseihalotalea indica TaxID=2867963 RepID=A0AA49JKN3_9BACT|nr:bile acid:sodium symporter family protein [Tunicatimonas sp. TK19036]WKN40376.1 bile acid:sodium symporter family protein [Tunicatimonas sp. TK19036]
MTGRGEGTGWLLTAFFLCLSLAFRSYEALRGFSFTLLILASVTAAMFHPEYFRQIGGFDLKRLFTPLLQIIMFGMGTTMSMQDFAGVVRMPRGVVVGMLCQFTIMPLVGFSLAHLLGVQPEIAAGIILIGSVPSGLASNVMSYLAKANLALSVTLTALATLLAPLITPLLMAGLAGEFLEISTLSMMIDMMKIVVLPVVAGLIFHHVAHGRFRWLDEAMPGVSMFGIAYIITIITAAGRDALLEVGLILLVAGIVHNLLGYFLGYWGARLCRLPERDCRTVALEVGMQNGGLASALANELGKIATVGLAPAIFGPVMNVTGSILATFWRSKPLPEETTQETVRADHDKAISGL